jgi:hypothetical protein
MEVNVAKPETAPSKKCRNTEKCGHNAEPGHDQCCSCLAQEADVPYVVMRQRLESKKESSPPFVKGGWG